MRSLRVQLTVPIILAFLVLGLATWLLLEQQIRARLVAEFDAALAARATVLETFTQFEEADPEEGEPAPFLEFDLEPETIPEYAGRQAEDPEQESDEQDDSDEAESDHADLAGERAYFQMWQGEALIARSPSLAGASLPRLSSRPGERVYRDVVLPDGTAGRLLSRRFYPRLDEEWGDDPADRERTLRERYPDLDYPLLTLSVAVPRASLDRTVGFVAWTLAAGLLVLMVAVSLLIAAMTEHGLRPLRRLKRELEGIDSERLAGRVDEQRLPLELVPVGRTINTLLSRLQEAFAKERLFTRNIAHELRTPIAELRSIGEVGARWPDDADANAGFFADIGRIGGRMDLMVSNLLMMARQESGQALCNWESIDLAERLRAATHRFRTDAEECDIDVELDAPLELLVRADAGSLEMIIANLVSNATHHGSHGGDIRISAWVAGERAAFAVENACSGLTTEDLPFLFDRFWRKDAARSSDRHVGLGLPLVQSLVAACGWSVAARLVGEHRFRIEVSGVQAMATALPPAEVRRGADGFKPA